MIPRDDLCVLRNEVPVLTVLSRLGIATRRRGARRSFRCPACQSCHATTVPRANLARCFACRRNFNPIDLVMAERRSTFLQAVRYVRALLP